MKVTKGMLHPDLQKSFTAGQWMATLLKRKPVIKLANRLDKLLMQGKKLASVDCEEVFVPSSDGNYQIRTRIYRPKDITGDLPAMLYIHGGGYIMGSPETGGDVIERFIATRPCVVVAPDYRKAYTQPFPAGFNDCYDTLLWLKNNAGVLGILERRYIVAGHSAGGGLTAAVTLKARDTQDVDIAFQMPIYPMIDDQQPDDADRYIESPVWDTQLNAIGWGAYLADLRAQGEDIPAYAAPARNQDYRGFPPTITFVGSLEPFYQETEAYVAALRQADIAVAYKLYEGCFHAFELIGKGSICEEALTFTFDSYAEYYDQYVKS